MKLNRAIIPSLLIGTVLLGSGFGEPPYGREPAPGRSHAMKEMQHAARLPETIALVFYADWCPACKALDPKVNQVRPEFKDKSILWVMLDQTDKDSRQASYLAAALGAADTWKDNAGKTGFVVLVDGKTKAVVGKLTADQKPEQIRQTLASVKG